MATCKDCLHYEICSMDLFADGMMIEADTPICNTFKDKSKFVELYFNSNCPDFKILAEIDGYVIATIFESKETYSSKEEAEQAFYKKMEQLKQQ